MSEELRKAAEAEYDRLTAALVVLTEYGVPSDIMEVLVGGSLRSGIRPGALSAALTGAEAEPVARNTSRFSRLSDEAPAVISPDAEPTLRFISTAELLATTPPSRESVIEECARVADNFTGAQHAAHDMATGVFPKQSYMGEAIAAAIRKLKG